MRLSPWAGLGLGLLVVTAGLSACGPTASSRAAPAVTRQLPDGGVAYVAVTQEPDTLNPLLSGQVVSADLVDPVIDGLVAYLPTGFPANRGAWQWRPILATNVPTLANGGVRLTPGGGMTVTYHLRRGVRFANGQPFTAQNVVYTWRLIMDPKTNVYSNDGYNLITAIDTPNPYTVVLHFSKPYAPYLELFDESILPNLGPAMFHGGINHAAYNLTPFGTGPFMVQSFHPNQSVTLVPNPYYPKHGGWDGPYPRLRKLVVSIVPDLSTLADQMQQGTIQLADDITLTRSLYRRFAAIPHVRLESTPSLQWQQYTFNLRAPIVRHRRVREAILYALDRQRDVRVLGPAGAFQVATTDQAPLSWAHDAAIPAVRPDLAKATALLRQAGWRKGAGGFRYKNGRELSLHIVTTAGDPLRQELMTLTAAQLQAVGIQVVPVYQPANTLFGQTLPQGNFQVAQFSWVDAPDPDDSQLWAGPSRYGPSQFPPQGANYAFYNNPAVDRLVYRGLATVDQAQRKHIYDQIQVLLFHDLPAIPLFYMPATFAVSDSLSGPAPNPFGYGLWNANYWRSARGVPPKG